MYLSDYDLKQLNEDSLRELPAVTEPLLGLSIKLLADLKEARDRLNRTPQNSSQPPSTQAPWEKVDPVQDEDEIEDVVVDQPDLPLEPLVAAVENESQKSSESGSDTEKKTKPRQGRPGRPLGAPGVSRTQQLPITAEQIHRQEQCTICGASLAGAKGQAYTARYEIDVVLSENGMPGLVVTNTKHIYLDCQCGCGQWARAKPGRANAEEGWTVELTEWHIAGPMLTALICALALRMRLSRARIKELLHDWLGLNLSVATINQCIHEAGRAVEPVVQNEILEAVRQADVLHVDETSWSEGKQLLWLWVFTCTSVVLFVVGKRTRELVVRILSADFEGWLMSDGYGAYRGFDQRLRCLAHIIRKARGLTESLDQRAQKLGKQALDLIEAIIVSVYQARAAPPSIPLRELYSQQINAFYDVCVAMLTPRTTRPVPSLASCSTIGIPFGWC